MLIIVMSVEGFIYVVENLLDKPTPSVEDIANKHNVSVEQIEAQLAKGIEVETEHTSSRDVAREIALDHLNELADYYDRLEKVEQK